MCRNNWLISAVCFTLLCGCAARQKTDTAKSPAETAKPAKAKPFAPLVRMVKSADGSVSGEIVGTPAQNSKFSQLQIGMKLEQVEDLIGRPDNKDSRITGKQFQPFYFGGDTQRTEVFYKDEGQLTFSNTHPDSAADTLIRIIVKPDANATH